MDGTTPTPPRKPKRYEFKATDCLKHEGRCAMRRERHVKGPFECVYCANERAAAELLAPDALPPVPPPAAEPAHPPAQPSQTEAVEGRGVVCSPLERLLGKWPGDESDAELVERMRAMDLPGKQPIDADAYYRARRLSSDLRTALGALENGETTPEALGIELLRVSNELATESKRLRKPHEHAVSRTDEGSPFGHYVQHCDCGATRTHEVRPSLTAIEVVDGPWRAPESAPRAPEPPCDCGPGQICDHCLRREPEVTPSGGAEALPSGWRAHAKQWGRR